MSLYIHILICDSGFEAGGTKSSSNIAPWTRVGKEQNIVLQTELNSCFEQNKVALKMDVQCDNSDGVGVSNPGFWGMVRIINDVSHMNFYFHVPLYDGDFCFQETNIFVMKLTCLFSQN